MCACREMQDSCGAGWLGRLAAPRRCGGFGLPWGMCGMQRQSRGVGVGVSCLSSPVVSRIVFRARPVKVVASPWSLASFRCLSIRTSRLRCVPPSLFLLLSPFSGLLRVLGFRVPRTPRSAAPVGAAVVSRRTHVPVPPPLSVCLCSDLSVFLFR